MFKCRICGEKFANDMESEEPKVCIECYDEMLTAELIAIDII